MLGKVFGTVRARLRARAACEALDGLSDAALDDIGLTRAGLSALRNPAGPAGGTRPSALLPSAQVLRPDFARRARPTFAGTAYGQAA